MVLCQLDSYKMKQDKLDYYYSILEIRDPWKNTDF